MRDELQPLREAVLNTNAGRINQVFLVVSSTFLTDFLLNARRFLPLVLQMSNYKLFLLRHGEGAWNKENRFCSWVDQKLSENGVKEAQECGKLLKEQGVQFDVVFTSILSRSVQTAWLVLEAMAQEWVPVVKDWRLNERHYGSLIGLNRAEMAAQHGEEQVKLWRRSYDITPPPIDESHPYFLEIYNDRRYTTCDVPKGNLPRAESLKEVLERLMPYWTNTIVPEIRKGRTVLISAHGNSCRALLKHLEGTPLQTQSAAAFVSLCRGLTLVQFSYYCHPPWGGHFLLSGAPEPRRANAISRNGTLTLCRKATEFMLH